MNMRNLYEKIMNHKYGGVVIMIMLFIILNVLMLLER
jgi:hypothetical protein